MALATQGAAVIEVSRTTAVDWMKLKLITRVIIAAAVPHETAFKPLFNIVFMVALPFSLCGALPHAARRRHGVIYNYNTR